MGKRVAGKVAEAELVPTPHLHQLLRLFLPLLVSPTGRTLLGGTGPQQTLGGVEGV